jgi:hypothetical protein
VEWSGVGVWDCFVFWADFILYSFERRGRVDVICDVWRGGFRGRWGLWLLGFGGGRVGGEGKEGG